MGRSSSSGGIRIEKGFIGAHADIGGVFGAHQNQLAQVALTWMVEQAISAGIKMSDSPLLHSTVANPVIHDKSDNQYLTVAPTTDYKLEDRVVHYMNGTSTTQMNMTGVGMTQADTLKFIDYYAPDMVADGSGLAIERRSPKADFSTGTIDMSAYLAWLKTHGYTMGGLTVK